jgi:hypothetical protein
MKKVKKLVAADIDESDFQNEAQISPEEGPSGDSHFSYWETVD